MTAAAGVPAAVEALRARAAELSDLGSISSLLFWDRSTQMPAAGAQGRAEQSGTLERVHHERLVDPQVGRWLDEAERWAAGEDPASDAVREIAMMRRDHEKAVRVPGDLAAALATAAGLGEAAWLRARAADDFALMRDALERNMELRHRYVECFDDFEHPYDVLLDDFEPGATTAEIRPLFAALREALAPLVAAAGEPGPRNAGVFDGSFPPAAQETALREVVAAFGFHDGAWRLDPTRHPFAQALDTQDVRITTVYDRGDLGVALFSVLHEFGHGMYDARVEPGLRRTALARSDSLGLHESQSRLWENALGRSLPFCRWVLPVLARHLGGLRDLDADRLFWAVNTVRPSPVRIFADETTYNLHIILRFELETALLEGSLAVTDLPDAWAEGLHRLLGVEVPSDNQGVLQDVHWGAGLIGYFPTYAFGNLCSAQLWESARAALGDLDQQIERGEFGPLMDWLTENVHRHGRRFDLSELMLRATGQAMAVGPFVRYLQDKLAVAGVVPAK